DTLLEAVTKRFADIEEEPLYSLATVIDPRYQWNRTENQTSAKNLSATKTMPVQPTIAWYRSARYEGPGEKSVRNVQREEWCCCVWLAVESRTWLSFRLSVIDGLVPVCLFHCSMARTKPGQLLGNLWFYQESERTVEPGRLRRGISPTGSHS
ncbi:hypothetical protein GOODEAATRI_020969, partial [Goodea atripinnis]